MATTQRRENRKAGRLDLEIPLRVLMGSIGSQVKYEALTKNVSYSGIFLSFENPKRFPFKSESILEVWLELEKDSYIFFNGKLARIVFKGEEQQSSDIVTGPGIAIHIIQMDSENERKYNRFVEDNISIFKDKKEISA